jgi:hypothetical protein
MDILGAEADNLPIVYILWIVDIYYWKILI